MDNKSNSKNRYLVVAAHPDDEVLGCGGTIARLAQEGHQVYIAILGEGVTSRYAQREEADKTMVATLRAHSHKVKELLCAKDLFIFDLPDNRFDTIPLLEVVKIIESLIERLQPEVVYTQHGGDLNIDHVITHRAVLTATRPISGCPVKKLYAYEVPSSTEWAFAQFAPAFRPNVFVDISTTLDTKIKAMQIYESEARPFPHPRSPEALRVTAQRWGSVVGLVAAEAFELIYSLKHSIVKEET
ncbi:MAG: PIG-L family deacetylase [Desulfobacteraceae bacterium]|nr:PIG-L family deacetylase [Desulfobacteraceae bacterium]